VRFIAISGVVQPQVMKEWSQAWNRWCSVIHSVSTGARSNRFGLQWMATQLRANLNIGV